MIAPKAVQFDPSQPYPEHCWASAGEEFYCAAKRGHLRIHKGEWIVDFDGELAVLSDGAYRKFFEGPKVDAKPKKKTARAT